MQPGESQGWYPRELEEPLTCKKVKVNSFNLPDCQPTQMQAYY